MNKNNDKVENFQIISCKSEAIKLICFSQLSQEKISEYSLATSWSQPEGKTVRQHAGS